MAGGWRRSCRVEGWCPQRHSEPAVRCQIADTRRGAADRGQYRQASGATEAASVGPLGAVTFAAVGPAGVGAIAQHPHRDKGAVAQRGRRCCRNSHRGDADLCRITLWQTTHVAASPSLLGTSEGVAE